MQVHTTRFGSLEIDEAAIMTFPEGIPAFESCHRFVVVEHRSPNPDRISPFQWLQSIDDGRLAFLTTDPRLFFPDYAPTIPASDRAILKLTPTDPEPRIITLLTVPRGDPAGITANLMAPVVFNPGAMLARQVILNDEHYQLKHRLVPEERVPAPAAPSPIIGPSPVSERSIEPLKPRARRTSRPRKVAVG